MQGTSTVREPPNCQLEHTGLCDLIDVVVSPVQIRVLLPARSLQVLTKDARYRYTHGIAMDDVLDERRVSVTFRQSPLTVT